MSADTKKMIMSNTIKAGFGLVVFGIMIFGFYFNSRDGVWNGTYWYAENWELSLGRWAIRYLDKLFFGIHVHPYSSVITFILFSVGTSFIMNSFNIPIGSYKDYFVSFAFLGNVVVCISLSYLYTSMIYGAAFCVVGVCFYVITNIAKNMNEACNKMKLLVTTIRFFRYTFADMQPAYYFI